METRDYASGEKIFEKGDRSEHIYIILSGRVEVIRSGEEVQDHVGILGEGSMFGEMGVLHGEMRHETAKALEPTRLEVLSKDDVASFFDASTTEIQKLILALTNKIKDIKNTPQPHFRKVEKMPAIEQMEELDVIRPLLDDPAVNDILINAHDKVYVERDGHLELTDISFANDAAVLGVAEKIVEKVGRRLDPHRPMVDARLLDGSRVNIVAAPLAVDAPTISIRKFSTKKLTLDVMYEQGNVSRKVAEFLKVAGKCRMNVLISGGTGSGKTTLLNAVSQHIDDDERVITIEDAAELKMQQPHLVRMETKPLSARGRPEDEVTMRDLVRNALRMRPDRIIVGEVRGAEAFDMLQAMNTGHEGSMSTIHANHPRDALARLENMISMANLNLPSRAMREQITSALHLVVQISRMRDGQRRVNYITEIVGMEGDTITTQDLYRFEVKGERKDGKLDGVFKWSGIMPRFLRRAAYYGQYDNLSNALGVKLPKLD